MHENAHMPDHANPRPNAQLGAQDFSCLACVSAPALTGCELNSYLGLAASLQQTESVPGTI